MTTTIRSARITLWPWIKRLVGLLAAVLAVTTLATLLLGFSVLANIVHLTGDSAAASPSVRGFPLLPAPTRWVWPLPGQPAVARRFQPPPRPWLAGHRGVDLSADPGTPVRATGAGIVSFAGDVAGQGVVSVQHSDGLRTTYQPLTPGVQIGQFLASGDPVGVLAAGHESCQATCLHWGLRAGKDYLDPLALVGRARVRLLPLAVP